MGNSSTWMSQSSVSSAESCALQRNCTEIFARFPPGAGFRIHVLKESEFSARINLRVRQERLARVYLPNIVIARLVQSVRVPIESADAQRSDGARHGIAANVDHFRPNMFAFLRANRVSNFTRKGVVIGLGQPINPVICLPTRLPSQSSAALPAVPALSPSAPSQLFPTGARRVRHHPEMRRR
jgi:hypothetical protein